MKAFGSALISAFCIQTALVAGYVHYPGVAAVLWVAAGIVIIQRVKEAGGGVRRRTQRRLRDALATIILVGGLLRFVIIQLPFGGGSGYHAPAPAAPSNQNTSKNLKNIIIK